MLARQQSYHSPAHATSPPISPPKVSLGEAPKNLFLEHTVSNAQPDFREAAAAQPEPEQAQQLLPCQLPISTPGLAPGRPMRLARQRSSTSAAQAVPCTEQELLCDPFATARKLFQPAKHNSSEGPALMHDVGAAADANKKWRADMEDAVVIVLDVMRCRPRIELGPLGVPSPQSSPLCSPDGSPVARTTLVRTSSGAAVPASSQPSVLLDRRRVFAAIYDGHGGKDCSAFLRARLHQNLARELAFRELQAAASISASAGREHGETAAVSGRPGDNAAIHADAWRSAYLMTNLQMRRTDIDSGSTAVTCLIDHNPRTQQRWLHVANTGDSSAILCRKVGLAERLTVSHRPTHTAERDRITSCGGIVFQKRLMGVLSVSRAFGNFSLKLRSSGLICDPACRSLPLTLNDRVLVLCCDGVTDVMSDEDVQKCVINGCERLVDRARKRSEDSIRSAATKLSRWLVHCAISRGSTDNVSAVVVIL